MANEVNSRATGADQGSSPVDPRLYLRDEELERGVGLILAGERALGRAAEAGRETAGLGKPELQVLLAIRFLPGQDVAALRGHLGATVPTLARLLGTLDQRGLIRRDRDARDARRRNLYLSPAGEAVLRPVVEAMRETLKQAYREAGPQQVAGARAVLEALAR